MKAGKNYVIGTAAASFYFAPLVGNLHWNLETSDLMETEMCKAQRQDLIPRRGHEVSPSSFDFFLKTLFRVAARCRVKFAKVTIFDV